MIKHYFKHQPLMIWGAGIILLLVVTALGSGLLAPMDPVQQTLSDRLLAPSGHHWMGTDQYGRDVFSRLIYGSRISLAVGLVAVSIYIFIGTVVGSVAGYYGGVVDALLMRLVDILLCIPTFFLILMVIAFVGPSIINIMIIIGLTSWTDVARLVRGEVLSLKEREFVQAAKVIGMKDIRIIMKHILPNAMGPILVVATLGIGGAILTESSLSFLGLGVQPPTPSWGNMLQEGKDHLTDAWWLVTFPGLAIFITVLGYNLLGEGLRDLLDPRLRGSGRNG
ncbi:MAG TPA: nickel transporter permease [bacterium]|jgi:peptide/nickel transport system permease protein|nr:nickel transporter permease [bacterium]